ncbi:hypothetical protein PI125_g2393 [Phytophthora idaei]|nr:hypothetical protein PI125_g2393 [Phytophthora idaei]KAG3171323.1 hypothetical protein PI126_g1955 [Phytophthora idaei]
MGHQRYTINEKMMIAKETKKATIRAVDFKYKVDRKCIWDWSRKLLLALSTRCRRSRGGRRMACEELATLLIGELRDARRKHRRVTRHREIEMAANFFRTMIEQPGLILSNELVCTTYK